jgi:hypothetical protein
MTLIIGSTAMKHWFPEAREPKDRDIFSPDPWDTGDRMWDDRFRWYGSWDHAFGQHPLYAAATDPHYATPDELLTIKLSHAGWDLKNGSWFKHMEDVAFLQERGAKVIEPLYDLLYSIWEDKHGKKRVDLNYDKAEFFDDAVRRKYDHDSLHRSVALTPGYPLWEKFLADGQEIKMDMKKIWAASLATRQNLFWEEIAATALERTMIPSDYTASPRAAWAKALKLTVTSLTKGKSSRFIAENYSWYRKPAFPYVEMHLANTQYLEEL